MHVEITPITNWKRVADAARFTVGKAPLDKEPSDKFKHDICNAEHSPLRLLEFDIKCYDVPYWVAMHLARHHEGVEKFITTQRTDRTGSTLDRDEIPQGARVNMQLSINAQALINISRVRLCAKASPETAKLWRMIKAELKDVDPVIWYYMMPNCAYRGFKCHELTSCGYCERESFYE